jgi:SpoVK/Ycf46/Vps4 family AAA+-type ATPase
MSEREDPMEFDEVREQAAAAVRDSDAESVYVGLVGDSVDDEYYFANDVDEDELQEMATRQLGMLARVLSEQSGASIDQVAKHAAETAKKMNLR